MILEKTRFSIFVKDCLKLQITLLLRIEETLFRLDIYTIFYTVVTSYIIPITGVLDVPSFLCGTGV